LACDGFDQRGGDAVSYSDLLEELSDAPMNTLMGSYPPNKFGVSTEKRGTVAPTSVTLVADRPKLRQFV
jgi:hypothetical protein